MLCFSKFTMTAVFLPYIHRSVMSILDDWADVMVLWLFGFCVCSLFSKWTYHWPLSNEDKMKEEMSDFRKVTSRTDEAEQNKPKIKFKVVPPPPKPKPEPPPPPPPPRKQCPKPRRPKRKVEVDVFQLCWRESWMSLKPPKYLYLKAKELKSTISGFTAIELSDNRNYKAKRFGSEAELTSSDDEWGHSWKQVWFPGLEQTKTRPSHYNVDNKLKPSEYLSESGKMCDLMKDTLTWHLLLSKFFKVPLQVGRQQSVYCMRVCKHLNYRCFWL